LTAASRPILEVTGLVKHFDGRKILDGVGFTLGSTETVAITGANGSGKSTLLRILAAASRADGGRITLAGLAVHPNAHQTRAHLSLLGQEPALYDELTPLDHLRWWMRLTKRTGDPMALLIEAGLRLQATRPASTLSRGQRQRLALAMAMVGDPPLLLLDEPFSALDAQGRAWLEERLMQRRGRKATILALHETDAKRLADRVLHLVHHRLSEVP
jgi:ABC-2 type transport system ATP-binding protein